MTPIRPKWTALLQWIASVILAVVFITAALPKINDVANFALNIDQYQILPSTGVTLLALVLPWMELVIGFGLLVPRVQKTSRLLCTAFLLLFIVVHISVLVRGLDIQCACFGDYISASSASEALLRNAGLLSLAFFVIYWEHRHKKQNSQDCIYHT